MSEDVESLTKCLIGIIVPKAAFYMSAEKRCIQFASIYNKYGKTPVYE